MEIEDKVSRIWIEMHYIGICSLLAKLAKPIKQHVPGNSDYLDSISTALDDFESKFGGRFEVWRDASQIPYAIEPAKENKSGRRSKTNRKDRQ